MNSAYEMPGTYVGTCNAAACPALGRSITQNEPFTAAKSVRRVVDTTSSKNALSISFSHDQ